MSTVAAWLPAVLVVALACALAAVVAARGAPPTGHRAAALVAATATLAVAVGPPLDRAADHGLAPHMLQHVLLFYVAGPLLAVGRAGRAVTCAAGIRPPRAVAARRALARHPVGAVAGASCLAAAAMAVWHVPSLHDGALGDDFLHLLEHATLVAAGALPWVVVLHAPRRRALAGLAAAFLTSLAMTALAVALVLASRPWYPGYASPHPLQDQQVAGVVLWAVGGAMGLLGALALLVRAVASTAPDVSAPVSRREHALVEQGASAP